MNKLIAIFGTVLLLALPQQISKLPAPRTVRASYYSSWFEGRLMANGHPFHAARISAASYMFPLGMNVRVTNKQTGRYLVVPITDRGPAVKKFGIDLSPAAFTALGFTLHQGWGWVTVEGVR